MKNKNLKLFNISFILFVLFIIYTLCVKFIDVANIGPNNSAVGFSSVNGFVHNLFGVNFTLYNITDWGGFDVAIPATIFAITGLVQLIKRKNLFKVDSNILALGILYILSFIVFLFFQIIVINRRPVLINGVLESSYPSSTTILSLTFLLSISPQLDKYINNKVLKNTLKIICVIFCAFLIIVRVISGVHWFTDIVGGIIISATLLCFYYGLLNIFENIFKNNISKTSLEK